MSAPAVGAAFVVMLALMLLGLPIAAVMAAMGVVGGVLAFGWPLVDSMGPVMWVVAAGVDPVWFGIFVILMCELGMITPPVGMNLYVVQGVRRDGGPFADVVRGAFPFVLIMLAFVLVLIAVPGIATWLPRTMFAP